MLVDPETKKEDVKFKALPDALHLSVAGETLLQGKTLARDVDPDESGWIFENEGGQRLIIITLQKVRPKSALKSARQWPSLWKEDT